MSPSDHQAGSPSANSNGIGSGTPSTPAAAGTPKSATGAKGKDKASDDGEGKGTKSETSASGSHANSPAPNSGEDRKDGEDKPASRPTTSALHLNQYIARDHLHAAALYNQTTSKNELIREKRKEAQYYADLRRVRATNPGAIYGPGYQGFGNGYTDGKTQIVYPAQRKRVGGRKATSIRFNRKALQEAAEQQEILVPVRLEVDYEKHKLRDTFTWNLHDRTVPTRVFAEQLVEDFHLPLTKDLVEEVRKQIDEQVTDFHPHVFFEDQPLNPTLPYWAYKNDEMRILIKLNITIGHHTLVDQFEWDINNPNNSPEEFAQLLTREMCLSGEFTTAIAHSIREQAQLYTKSLYMTGHPFDGRPIEEEDLRNALLPSPVPNTIRTAFHAKDYTPLLYELNDQDLDRAEKSELREARRKRRRRGGPALPDLKDVPKTYRSQIVSSVLPGAVQSVSELRTHKRTVRDGDPSESEDSDSGVEPTPQPAPANLSNLTRRQRGAALNAQTAMRNSAARSATPELEGLQPPRHLTQRVTPSPLSFSRRADVPESILVKLRVPKDKFIKLLKDLEAKEKAAKEAEEKREKERIEKEKAEAAKKEDTKIKAEVPDTKPARGTPTPGPTSGTPTPGHTSKPDLKDPKTSASPAPAATKSTRGASSTPSNATPSASSPPRPKASKEKVVRSLPLHTKGASSNGSQPPPPAWLTKAIADIAKTYPDDKIETVMRLTPLDPETEQPLNAAQQSAAAAKGVELKMVYSPKIRCLDCPGKAYIPGPGETLENFMVHLRNKNHRDKVDARTGKK